MKKKTDLHKLKKLQEKVYEKTRTNMNKYTTSIQKYKYTKTETKTKTKTKASLVQMNLTKGQKVGCGKNTWCSPTVTQHTCF